MSSSKVLRDTLVTQLQKENNFLKNIFKNNSFYGKKIMISSYIQHYDTSGNHIQDEREGRFIKFLNSSSYKDCALVLIKKDNHQQFVAVPFGSFYFLEDIEF